MHNYCEQTRLRFVYLSLSFVYQYFVCWMCINLCKRPCSRCRPPVEWVDPNPLFELHTWNSHLHVFYFRATLTPLSTGSYRTHIWPDTKQVRDRRFSRVLTHPPHTDTCQWARTSRSASRRCWPRRRNVIDPCRSGIA
jgi:hypothetical protein